MAGEGRGPCRDAVHPAGVARPPDDKCAWPPPAAEDIWLPGLVEPVSTGHRFPRLTRSINEIRARDAWLGHGPDASVTADRPQPGSDRGGRTGMRRSVMVGAFASAFAVGLLTTIGLNGGHGSGEAVGGLLPEEAEAAPLPSLPARSGQEPPRAAGDRAAPVEHAAPLPAHDRAVPAVAAMPAALPDLRPGLGRALKALGERQQAAGDVEAAFASFKRAAILVPRDAGAFYDWGYALQQKGELPAAIEKYRTAIRLDPGHRYARYNLGYLMQSVGDDEGARSVYEAAVAASAATALTHYNLGYLLQKAGSDDAAIERYRSAIAADPALAWAHYNLGYLLERRGEMAGAGDAYRRALAASPDLALAKERLAILAAR